MPAQTCTQLLAAYYAINMIYFVCPYTTLVNVSLIGDDHEKHQLITESKKQVYKLELANLKQARVRCLC